jgi:hypothetical protein
MELFFILSFSTLLDALDLAILGGGIQKNTAVVDLLTDLCLVAIALDRLKEVQEAYDVLALVAYGIAPGVVAFEPFEPGFDFGIVQEQLKAGRKVCIPHHRPKN